MTAPNETEKKKISDVGSWKEDGDIVTIEISRADQKEIVVHVNEVCNLHVKRNETNFEIVIPKQEAKGTPPNPPAPGGGSNDDKKSNKNESDKNKNNALPKPSDNVLGSVMNVLKEYKGIVITAVIAISLGFLLRRKFN